MIKGTLAAAITPLRPDGGDFDDAGVSAVVDFLAESGVDGVLALGTTGEGVLFAPSERERIARAYIDAAGSRIDVAVHVGTLATIDAVRLAEQAAADGASAVAAIGPPYFAYDESALFEHFLLIGRACAPVDFYLYEFEARAGYALPLDVIERLRDALDNLRGIKISTTPWEKFSPYLSVGLDAFCGPEALIEDALAHGAIGAVSGLASGFPELVANHVNNPTPASSTTLAALRAELSQYPFHAAMKRVLIRRGVEIEDTVRRPLRALTAEETSAVDAVVDSALE